MKWLHLYSFPSLLTSSTSLVFLKPSSICPWYTLKWSHRLPWPAGRSVIRSWPASQTYLCDSRCWPALHTGPFLFPKVAWLFTAWGSWHWLLLLPKIFSLRSSYARGLLTIQGSFSSNVTFLEKCYFSTLFKVTAISILGHVTHFKSSCLFPWPHSFLPATLNPMRSRIL